MNSTAAIPASRSRPPERSSEPKTRGISGRSSRDAFAFYDRASSCWRTSQLTFDSDSATSSLILPAWGSLRGGELYERPTPALHIAVPDSLSLPTPTARDWKGGGRPTTIEQTRRPRGQGGLSDLPSAVSLLPTPTSMDSHSSGGNKPSDVTLTDAVVRTKLGTRPNPRLLPTPMANDENPGAGGELRAAITHGAGRRNETGTDTWDRPNRGRSSGEPTSPPSDDGSTSSDDQRHDQLTIGDA